MRVLTVFTVVGLCICSSPAADAGKWKLIREAFEGVNKQVQKSFGRTASRTSGKTASTTARQTAGRTTTAAGRGFSGQPAKSAGTLAVRSGSEAALGASETILRNLGQAGARASARLKPQAATRLAQLAPKLAQSPHRKEWIELIQKFGGGCVDFLWDHRSGLAVGAVTGAVLMKPADFLESAGRVAEAGVMATGEFIAKPAIDSATRHLTATSTQATGVFHLIAGMLTNLALIVAGWFLWKRFRRT
ncbi:MAG: hypothetical protein Fues2KO_04760 [Fuerstiella sp.]